MSFRTELNQGMNWIWRPTRFALYLRDKRCVYCGKSLFRLLIEGITITLDHLLPYSQGGSNAPDNLVMCCKPCNDEKGDQDWQSFAVRYGETAVLFIQETVKRELPRKTAKQLLQKADNQWTVALRLAAEHCQEDAR